MIMMMTILDATGVQMANHIAITLVHTEPQLQNESLPISQSTFIISSQLRRAPQLTL